LTIYTFKNFTELSPKECDEVLLGRNDYQVRRWMSSDRMITLEEHMRFMRTLKNTADKVYLRVEREERFVGVYSLTDIDDYSGIGGFWITTYARDRMLSLNVVYKCIAYIFEAYHLDRISGYQQLENKPVARLNDMLGFVPVAPPLNSDPRMNYLELTRSSWEQNVTRQPNLMKLIELAESRNEDKRI
jgi:UDP-4-amino-4,6-dideoxy-N-acetyl-beta-L-altrosamine N-acetyltransferase